MAIRNRRGNKADFDPGKMLSGESAVVIDNEEMHIAFAPGRTKKIATYEDMVQNIKDANQEIVDEITSGANAVANVVEGVLDGVNHLIDDTSGKYYKIGANNGEVYLEEIPPDTDPPMSETILDDIADLKNDKFDKTNIIQTTAVNDASKVPSSAVTYSLANQVTQLNDNLAELKRISSAIASGGTIAITHTANPFIFLVNIQGAGSNIWGSYILQGYSIGTDMRDHAITLGAGTNLKLEILNNSFVVTSTHTGIAYIVITVLMGDVPTLS